MNRTLCFFLLTALAQAATVRPVELKVEHRANPQGIDDTLPRLSWQLSPLLPTSRGLKQSAYHLQAATSPEALAAGRADLWDSGKVESAQSILVPYAGKPLTSNMPVWWRVQVWDNFGQSSDWSQPANWSMGLLKASDWKAKWIGRDEHAIYKHVSSPFQDLLAAKWIWYPEADPAQKAPKAVRFFQTIATVPAGRVIRHARFVLGADDSFTLTINGKPAGRGSAVVMPEVLDVAAWLQPGENLIQVRAENAREGTAGLIGVLRIQFTSGEPLVFPTGAEWKAGQTETSAPVPARILGDYGMKPWGEVGFVEEHALLARQLRKEFNVAAGLKRATVHFSGLGLSELEVNGTKTGDHVLSPNLSEYDKRVFYVTHDITGQLKPGKNALGVWLGNGRYWAPRAKVPIGTVGFGAPRLLLQLELEYNDGKRETIVSDESWKLTTQGPLRVNNEYDGEEYDARLEAAGWSKPKFNDETWQEARILEAPKGALVAQMAEPLRVMQTLPPVKVTEVRPGVFIYDMGQNMVGWVRLRAAGPKGTSITLRFAETLRPDGTLYLDNLRSARATDTYTLRGGGPEIWEPRFTYHGFRFVEVTGYPGKPTLASIEGRVVHDAMESAGEFTSSDSLLNRIHRNIYWGIRGNYRSIPTDCPQRDERQGWLGDRSVVSRSESYLFDVAAFYTKWMTDLADSQRPTGSIPDVSPSYWTLYNDGIVWPSTFVLAPQMVYEQYGDARVIQRNYPAMKKWIEYMRTFLKDGIMPKNTYGDWCVPPEKPELIHSQDPARVTAGALLSTAYYYRMLQLMSRYAKLSGHAADVDEYQQLANQVKAAFVKAYFKQEQNRFDNGTQTSSVLPLAFDLTPPASRDAVFQNLVNKIEKESDNHVGVGLVGAQWLMRTLSDNGRADLALTIATQKTYPGWGYMVQKDATTVWELWNGDTADPAMNSGNHVMQIGDLGLWMYEYLAGIRSDPDSPGFQHFTIKPYAVNSLSFAKATHRSPYGLISSSWKREKGKFSLSVIVPVNTTATVTVPALNVLGTAGLKPTRVEGNTSIFEVGSGQFTFQQQ
jgi:alpha-L-rhamnosidase